MGKGTKMVCMNTVRLAILIPTIFVTVLVCVGITLRHNDSFDVICRHKDINGSIGYGLQTIF